MSGGIRPIDLQGAMGRTPETTNPQHREGGPQAAQQVFLTEFRQASERQQTVVPKTPQGEKSQINADARQRGGQGEPGERRRHKSPAGRAGKPSPQEPGKGTRLDVRI